MTPAEVYRYASVKPRPSFIDCMDSSWPKEALRLSVLASPTVLSVILYLMTGDWIDAILVWTLFEIAIIVLTVDEIERISYAYFMWTHDGLTPDEDAERSAAEIGRGRGS